jgi:hypothetical protein
MCVTTRRRPANPPGVGLRSEDLANFGRAGGVEGRGWQWVVGEVQ